MVINNGLHDVDWLVVRRGTWPSQKPRACVHLTMRRTELRRLGKGDKGEHKNNHKDRNIAR